MLLLEMFRPPRDGGEVLAARTSLFENSGRQRTSTSMGGLNRLVNVDKGEKIIMIVFHESRAGFETDHKRIFSSDLNLVLR